MLQEAEVAKLTALLQKSEMKAKSLELTVEQKAKENEVTKTTIQYHLTNPDSL